MSRQKDMYERAAMNIFYSECYTEPGEPCLDWDDLTKEEKRSYYEEAANSNDYSDVEDD